MKCREVSGDGQEYERRESQHDRHGSRGHERPFGSRDLSLRGASERRAEREREQERERDGHAGSVAQPPSGVALR